MSVSRDEIIRILLQTAGEQDAEEGMRHMSEQFKQMGAQIYH